MSRPRFLADNDFNDHIIDGVLRREPLVDIVRVRDVGLDRAIDPDVLSYAAANRQLVVSHDVNTMRGHALARIASGQPTPGLFMVPQREPIAGIIDSLLLIWSASDLEEWSDRITFLPL